MPWEICQGIELDIVATTVFTKFDENRMKTVWLAVPTRLIGQLKIMQRPCMILLVIELGPDIIPTNMFNKLSEHLMKKLFHLGSSQG